MDMAISVNGEPVDPEWIQQEFSRIKSWHEQRSQVSCCERDDEFLAEAKDNVIGRVLLVQRARDTMPEPEEDQIRTTLDRVKKDYGGEEQFHARTGLLPDEEDRIRQQIIVDCKVDNFVRQVAESLETPEEDALRGFHRENISRYTSEPRVRALHIYKSLRQAGDREALFAECCRVRERLVEGEDFVRVAATFSDKPAEEVDLDWFRRGELMDEFEFVAFSMRVGEISPVFSSYHGFHIAKVTGREEASPAPFEEARERVVEDLGNHLRDDRIRGIIRDLRSRAEIEEEDEGTEPADD